MANKVRVGRVSDIGVRQGREYVQLLQCEVVANFNITDHAIDQLCVLPWVERIERRGRWEKTRRRSISVVVRLHDLPAEARRIMDLRRHLSQLVMDAA